MGSLQKDFPPPIWSPHWSPQQPISGLKSLIYIGISGGQTGIRIVFKNNTLKPYKSFNFSILHKHQFKLVRIGIDKFTYKSYH